MSKYKIDEIRKKLKETTGKGQDPDMFRPKPVNDDLTHKYYFYILPPYEKDATLKSGKATRGIDQFFVTHGTHWINNRPFECPYVNSKEECPFCKQGQKLLKGKTDKEEKATIYRTWLPNVSYMVNIYFPKIKQNPEELQDRVMFYNAPKTIIDIWQACLMADDPNIEIDPQAYGIFFDEENAFLFELAANKNGKNNGYTKSKFLSNGGKPRPIADSADAIQEILAKRHDLYSKIPSADAKTLAKMVDDIMHGDTANSGFDSDETTESVKTESKQRSSSEFDAEAGTELDKEIEKTTKQNESKPKPKAETKAETKPAPAAKPAASSDDDDLEALLAGLND